MSPARASVDRDRSAFRRCPESFPRRWLVLAVLVAGALSGAWGAGSAGAVTVVNATVEGATGGGGIQSVTDTQLAQAGCPQWGQETRGAGATGIGLYLNGVLKESVDIPPATWELATVLSCGLSAPTSGLLVLVQRTDGSYQQLSWRDLTQTSEYTSDSQASGGEELPLVGVNGAGVEYLRPWLGGQDDNWNDSIPDPGGPVTLELFENGSQPLAVTITPSVSGQTVGFSASAAGIPSSQLTCNGWDFGDRSSSASGANPEHTYTSDGNFDVVTQCSDTATGQTGPGHVLVHLASPSGGCGSCTTSSTPNPGPTGGPPSGPTNSHGSHPGAAPGKRAKHGGSRSGSHHAPTSTAQHRRASAEQKPDAARSGTAGLLALGSSGAGAGTNGTPATSTPAPGRDSGERKNPATTPTRFIAGRLIAGVTPLAPAHSPLVRVLPTGQSTAPPVRGSASISALGGMLGGLAVVLLLALGAGRELSGRGGWRALRLGS